MTVILVHKDTLLLTANGLRFGDEIAEGDQILGNILGSGKKRYKSCLRVKTGLIRDGFNVCTTQSDIIISEDSKVASLVGPTSFKKNFDEYNPYSNSQPLIEHLGGIRKLYSSKDVLLDLRKARLLGLLAISKTFKDSLTVRCHNTNLEKLESVLLTTISLLFNEKFVTTVKLWPDETIPWAWVKVKCRDLKEELNLLENDINSFLEIRASAPKTLEIFSNGLISTLSYEIDKGLNMSLIYREKRIRSILYHGLKYQKKLYKCNYSPIATPEIVHISNSEDHTNFGSVKTIRRIIEQEFVKLEFDERRFSIYGNLFLIS